MNEHATDTSPAKKPSRRLSPGAQEVEYAARVRTEAQEVTNKRGYAARWQSSTRSVDNWIKKGLPCLRIGKRKVRILTGEADAWMRQTFGN
jgi:hypothetical protein